MQIPKTQLSLLQHAAKLDDMNKKDRRWPFRPMGILHKRALGLAKRGLLRFIGQRDGADEFKITRAGRKLVSAV